MAELIFDFMTLDIFVGLGMDGLGYFTCTCFLKVR